MLAISNLFSNQAINVKNFDTCAASNETLTTNEKITLTVTSTFLTLSMFGMMYAAENRDLEFQSHVFATGCGIMTGITMLMIYDFS